MRLHRLAILLYVMATIPINAQNVEPKNTSSQIDNPEIKASIGRISSLSQSRTTFNKWYLGFVCLTAVAGVLTFVFQYFENNVGKKLTEEQSTLDGLKDAARAEMDLSVAKEFKQKDVEIAEARKHSADAQKESSEANAKAESFRLDIAKAKESSAEAEARAQEARSMAKGFEAEIAGARSETAKAQLELAKIQERMADRKLTDLQVSEIAIAVAPFAGQEFDVTPYWDLPESLDIANRIANALVLGGWKYVPPEKQGMMLGGTEGVQVWNHPAADEKVKKAAESLLMVLNREGIKSVPRLQNPANPKDDKLHLNVGSKP